MGFGNFRFFCQRWDPLMSKLSKKKFSIFQKFQKQNWKITFMGPFKHEQKQSHEFWWSLPLPCRNSEAVYGHPGHNGPPLLWIGLISSLSKLLGFLYRASLRILKAFLCLHRMNWFGLRVFYLPRVFLPSFISEDHVTILLNQRKVDATGSSLRNYLPAGKLGNHLYNYFDFHVCLSFPLLRTSVRPCVRPKTNSNSCSQITKHH